MDARREKSKRVFKLSEAHLPRVWLEAPVRVVPARLLVPRADRMEVSSW